MFRRHLPVKAAIELEDWNRFAAIFDIDGMSWSDRCAHPDDAIGLVLLRWADLLHHACLT